jgi:superfamily II DNA or RNA helicase
MINTTHPELAETRAAPLPAASLPTLKRMREEQCSRESQDFKLQPVQRFLRRVLSPDSPTRGLLMVHGTGAGKTCSAIQIAEEYIIRPEFQDKRVLVLANPSIQENFKSQIFDVTRVDPGGAVLSQQCTGRRYLEMLERSSDHTLQYTDKASKNRIAALASRIISEFYEFWGYDGFANMVNAEVSSRSSAALNKWIHDTFDNRLIIVDEAHNLRETTETTASKHIGMAMERILKTANGITLVLLTATPMYDTYDEIVYYFNLFLWNERRLKSDKSINPGDIFTESGGFQEGREHEFRRWCQDYVSFVKGENPFTFPFRLPPPDDILAEIDRETDIDGKKIKTPRKYLKLVRSYVHSIQEKAVKALTSSSRLFSEESPTLCVFPEGRTFRETFERNGDEHQYLPGIPHFLAPSKIALYSSKFALVTRILKESDGIVFVFSNLVTAGAQLFAMCLEEHGYESAIGRKLMKTTANEVPRGSKGKYVLFTSDTTEADIRRSLLRLRSPSNIDGSDIRIIIASPKVSEGVDFRYVRQIHVLDPWYNMSRIEQVLGRGMRTCSHSLLPFPQQNCTIYLHVCRYPKSKQETLDEYIYRSFIEAKAQKIAKVKRIVMESAMDCDLQNSINSLPQDWRDEQVPQIRAQDQKEVKLSLADMFAPTFEDKVQALTCKLEEVEEDKTHVRPLSAVLDVRDEVFDKLIKLFEKKPIWSREDLVKQPTLSEYMPDIVMYLIENAIDTGLKVGDGHIESKGDYLAYSTGTNQTMLERVLKHTEFQEASIPQLPYDEDEIQVPNIEAKRESLPEYIKNKFSTELQDWYIVDAVLTRTEKIAYLLTTNWDAPYSKALATGGIIILGVGRVFDLKTKRPITPIGEKLDQYKKWRKDLEDKFISKKTDIFASMKEDKLIFNLDPKKAEVEVVGRSKTIGGQACTSFKEDTLKSFAVWLSGEGFPAQATGKKERCMYLNFLVRQSILASKQGIYWITPEEFEVLNEKGNKDLREKLR